MRTFHCDHCRLPIFFENSACTRCGHTLAYLPDIQLLATLDPQPDNTFTSPAKSAANRSYRLCQNYSAHQACNWAIPAADPNPFCLSCRLNLTIPDLSLPDNLTHWRKLESAKRRLIYQLLAFNLPLEPKTENPATGLGFNFLADAPPDPTGKVEKVLTGHADGIITLNVNEADDAHREQTRTQLHEPYRTLLGHFRHEIGHYYWDRLLAPATDNAPNTAHPAPPSQIPNPTSQIRNPQSAIRNDLTAFRHLFGDERTDYAESLKRHYTTGPTPNWQASFVSEYAAVHPWEDFAETFAHYLHITDTLETARSAGLSLTPPRPDEPALPLTPASHPGTQSFDQLITAWFPLTYILNNLNRGMGLPDAYPFVLSTPALEKLAFVHNLLQNP